MAVAADADWRFCEPDYAVLVPDASLWGDANRHKVVNEHFHVLVSPKSGDLLAFWTQESYEGSDDMHISFARSRDGGKTWTAPRVLRGSPKPGSGIANALWQLPMFSKSGRLYCFWNEREKPGRGQGVGYMKGAYSDDDGETWSEPQVVWQPRRWCSWQRPLRLAKGGRYLTAVSIADEQSARTCFMRFDNLDDDPEIAAVKVSLFMEGAKTLDGEEASIVKLPDGRLFAVMRSRFGVPLWTVSPDAGETWSDAKAVVDATGKPIRHPRSPCPIYDLGGESAGSGRYLTLFTDTFDPKIGQWEGRGPLYRYDGTFDPKSGQPVRFEKREILLKRPGTSHYGNSCYSSFTKRGDEGVLWFPDNKFYLLGKVIEEAAPEMRLRRFETDPGALTPTWKGCHVQGFAFSDEAVYLGVDRSGIYKFDLKGRLLKHTDAPNHTGDICWHEGRLYTSVDVLEGPRPKRSGIVQVYDADLKLLREAYLEQGIDGICARDGKLYLGMNADPRPHRVNQIGVMDMVTLKLERRIDIDTGFDTEWGTQDLAVVDGDFWVAFYSRRPLAVFGPDWKLKRTFEFNPSTGFDAVPAAMRGDRVRIGRGTNFKRSDGDPAYRIDFHELRDGRLTDITAHPSLHLRTGWCILPKQFGK